MWYVEPGNGLATAAKTDIYSLILSRNLHKTCAISTCEMFSYIYFCVAIFIKHISLSMHAATTFSACVALFENNKMASKTATTL